MSISHELQVAPAGESTRLCALCGAEHPDWWLQVVRRDALPDGTPVAMASSHARAVCRACVRGWMTGLVPRD